MKKLNILDKIKALFTNNGRNLTKEKLSKILEESYQEKDIIIQRSENKKDRNNYIEKDVNILKNGPHLDVKMTNMKEKEKDIIVSNKEINNNISKEIEKVLYKDDIDKLKYFLIELLNKQLWLRSIVNSIDNKVKIDLDKLKLKISAEEIILKILSDEKLDFELIKWYLNTSIRNKYFKLDLSKYSLSINLQGELIDTVLVDLKNLFEKYIIPYLENSNDYFILDDDIERYLVLDKEDKFVIEKKKIYISFFTEVNDLKKEHIIFLVSKMASASNFYIKDKVSILSNSFQILDSSKKDIYEFDINFRNNEVQINIGIASYENTRFSKVFIKNFVNNLIKTLKEILNKEVDLVENLKNLWVKVEEFKENKTLENLFNEKWFVWYDDVKEQIITHVIDPWKNKEKYLKFIKDKALNLKNIVPNAALFYWLPWTWKTTVASIIWEYLWYPFVYIPVNSIMSKWFGESENRLNDILETCWELAIQKWGVVIMIDEIDEIWKNRDKTNSDASNKILWVLLKKLDWLERINNILLVWWTNRQDTLDPALVSRFSQQIEFRLPNEKEIISILWYYLNFLETEDLSEIWKLLNWKSWRDIKKISEDFVRFLIKNEIEDNYIEKFKNFLENNKY